ncbi:hypothetical protein TWF718_009500 [Orbilia javanica]|uniref:Uncharacterized protein n=1 Tax=Orbilia javanica TaxID=47235 RepID=A0AAN8MKB3_9PEZI
MSEYVEYPHPLEEGTVGALSFLDQTLRQFSINVRSKPNWTEKIMDPKIMSKWIREAAQQDTERFTYWDANVIVWNAEVIKFIDQELKAYKAYVEKLRESGSCIEPDIDAVWRADGLIDEELRQELIDAVVTLENVPEEKKDWHPGTNNTVLDLVHPSMWPVVYGRTVDGDGKTIERPKGSLAPGNYNYEFYEDDESPYNSDTDDEYDPYDVDYDTRAVNPTKADRYMNGWSKKFCWLPSEFEVSPDGKSTKIASYINNLNGPGQKELFHPILEKIFSKFVPMFNHLLADLNEKNHVRYRGGEPTEVTEHHGDETKKVVRTEEYKKAWEKLIGEYENNQELTVDFEELLLEDYEPENGEHELWELGGTYSQNAWLPPTITDGVKLEGKTAKVIVKLANIVLTPENPNYNGGSWHVEAMRNERIVATGIYYYSQENITASNLQFRRTVYVDRNPRVQSSNWGIIHDMDTDSGVQELGAIRTIDNRAIVFPNIYQHCVSSFSLKDPTKPGYRKILVFFLCDPSGNHEIPTTSIIRPQQPELRAEIENILRTGPLGKLAEEIFQMVIKDLPPVIPLEEAISVREKLMKERSHLSGNSSMIHGIQYNFCEH